MRPSSHRAPFWAYFIRKLCNSRPRPGRPDDERYSRDPLSAVCLDSLDSRSRATELLSFLCQVAPNSHGLFLSSDACISSEESRKQDFSFYLQHSPSPQLRLPIARRSFPALYVRYTFATYTHARCQISWLNFDWTVICKPTMSSTPHLQSLMHPSE